jgi:pimeloyl-ACP methyl ester carboxylesterase
MRRFRVLLSAVVLAAGALVPAVASAAGTTNDNHSRHIYAGICTNMPQMHVALAAGQPRKTYIAGTFCFPFKPDRKPAIDILVHGATYDRSYWDSGYQFPDYSYVNRTLQAGRAVFYYDRLGLGKSQPLPSTEVTMYADAYVLHQIVQHFKPIFHTTNVIGHSYGSRIASLEASEYNDETTLVLTDSLHAAGPALVNGEIVQHPASQDPLFANQNLDSGWTTTTPDTSVNPPVGARTPFYNLATADPLEIAYDDAHKSIVSQTEFQQGQDIGHVPAGSNVSNHITRPILLILGQEDRLYCGLALDCSNPANVKAEEQPYYTSAAKLDVVVIPGTGHDLALHPSANASFAAISNWLEQ